jgi:hypothetical protein
MPIERCLEDLVRLPITRFELDQGTTDRSSSGQAVLNLGGIVTGSGAGCEVVRPKSSRRGD